LGLPLTPTLSPEGRGSCLDHLFDAGVLGFVLFGGFGLRRGQRRGDDFVCGVDRVRLDHD